MLTLWLVVKNPLSPAEHPDGLGVDCESFELGLDQFIVWKPSLRSACADALYRTAHCKDEATIRWLPPSSSSPSEMTVSP